MAKPKKSMVGASGEIIENPIKSNFKEGLSVFEYFISTHGARKGLADTALKTADAGYLTRRLVDVAQDVTITINDCGTIQGLLLEDLKEGEEIIEPLIERIIGRYTLEDVVDPIDGTKFVKRGVILDEQKVDLIADSNVMQVKVRSVLACESSHGVCAVCYGINLAYNKKPKLGDSIGIMAAQSIGEPGTQLTLRTFHIGGTASRIVEQSHMTARKDGKIRFSSNLDLIATKDDDKQNVMVTAVRNGKMELLDVKDNILSTWQVPYGSKVFVENNENVTVGQTLFAWDPYTDVILSRTKGIVRFKDMIEGETFIEEAVEGGKKMIVITESKNRDLSPHIEIESKSLTAKTGGASILPIRATVIVRDGDLVKAGQILVKIPRDAGKTRDITGGLPRIAELFEARDPANPAVITEIDGTIKYGKVKRGIREILVKGKDIENVYKIPYGKHILVHEGDFAFAGDRLCEGSVSPKDILKIGGVAKVQEFLVNAIQEVYRLQGVAINDKHIEVIVRQMMKKVTIENAGDTLFLQGDRVNRFEVQKVNEEKISG
jgi:DNA-directed RNA polymerase subunit beta'